ncbi:hypothetical protein KIPB_009481 [Kipferlia bialata]|uniref:Uncharacterized protein n=1 Tax=Kipferlia bialata TaxID=797122 RepID=A0A391NY32_9EUKA|nr:hypothetical protein KIPB_009481 [Kipferlia bialata]|eukprot:g9481.t1
MRNALFRLMWDMYDWVEPDNYGADLGMGMCLYSRDAPIEDTLASPETLQLFIDILSSRGVPYRLTEYPDGHRTRGEVELSIDYSVLFTPPIYDTCAESGDEFGTTFEGKIFFHGFEMVPPRVEASNDSTDLTDSASVDRVPDFLQAAQDMSELCSTLSALGLDPQPATFASL